MRYYSQWLINQLTVLQRDISRLVVRFHTEDYYYHGTKQLVWNWSGLDHLFWWFWNIQKDFEYPQLGFRIVDGRVWHSPILPKMANFKKVRYLTLPEIKLLEMLAYEKIEYYWSIFCSRCAKIVQYCICVNFVTFYLLYINVRAFARKKVRRLTILVFPACYKLTLFLLLRFSVL